MPRPVVPTSDVGSNGPPARHPGGPSYHSVPSAGQHHLPPTGPPPPRVAVAAAANGGAPPGSSGTGIAMAYSRSYSHDEAEQQQQQQQQYQQHYQQYQEQQQHHAAAAAAAATAAGGYYPPHHHGAPPPHAAAAAVAGTGGASSTAALGSSSSLAAAAAAAAGQGQGQGQGPIHQVPSYESRTSPALPHGHPAGAGGGAPPFHLPPAAYYGAPPQQQHPAIAPAMSRSFSGSSAGGAGGEVEQQHQQQQQQAQAQQQQQQAHQAAAAAAASAAMGYNPHHASHYHHPYGNVAAAAAAAAAAAYPLGQYGRPPSDHGGSDGGAGNAGAGAGAAMSHAASVLVRNYTSAAHESQLQQQQQQQQAHQYQQYQHQQQHQQNQRPPVAPATTTTTATANSNIRTTAEALSEEQQQRYQASGTAITMSNHTGTTSQPISIAARAPAPPASLPTGGADTTASKLNNSNTGQTNPEGAPATCTCKKSKCLKLYCQCFASKAMCGPSCRCQDCLNAPMFEQARTEAIRVILSRNPSAFDDKFSKGGGAGGRKGGGKAQHKIGCKCRKSACLKKYCECYHAGVKCSANCRCRDCKNTVDGGNNAKMGGTVEVARGGTASVAATGAGGGSSNIRPLLPLAPAPPVVRVRSPMRKLQPPQVSVAQPAAVGKPKASPGDPQVIEDAAMNLAFLRAGSPNRPENKSNSSSVPDISAMPSLTSSEEVSPFDNEKQEGSGSTAVGKQATSGPSNTHSQMPTDIISPDTERSAEVAMDTLLLAASALTELNASLLNPNPSTPSRSKKEVIQISSGVLPDRPETPSRLLRGSPKRKSSFGSDCPTPKRQPSSESAEGTGCSPDGRSNRRKNSRDVISSSTINEAMPVVGKGDQDLLRPVAGGADALPPFTPPIPPKLKKTRIGSVKKGDRASSSPFLNFNGSASAKRTPPRPPSGVDFIDSSARPSKAHADSDADDASSAGDSSDNQDNANADGQDVFRDRAATPPGRTSGEALTPASSRQFRKLAVNDSSAGESIGMDVELER